MSLNRRETLKFSMKNFLIKSALFLLAAFIFVCFSMHPIAIAKKSKKGGMAKKDIEEITITVNDLTQKIYAHSLFSPDDNKKLIEIKIKLDDAMLLNITPEFAPLYYKLGVIYKSREYKDEAIECYQTILENFGDTALAPKAQTELKKMGVKIKLPDSSE